jgi:DNA repair photolyase
MEPYAPSPQRRLSALKEVADRGFATCCRIDPLVPGVNDRRDSLRALAERVRDAGVMQIISSTFKLRWDSARRFAALFPAEAAAAEELYEQKTVQGYRYLRRGIRRQKMQEMRHLVHACGLRFSCCREGFAELNDGPCDARAITPGSPGTCASPESTHEVDGSPTNR